MSAHTPGPWSVGKHGVVLSTDPNKGICDPFPCDKRGERNDYGYGGETLANARLIAAAPELLEALKNLFAQVSVAAKEGHPASIYWPEMVAASTAIAKATQP